MQTTVPTQHVPALRLPQQDLPAERGGNLGPICGAISSAFAGATLSLLASACTLLGSKMLQAAGNDSYNPPPFVVLFVPTLLGATVLFGALGFLGGLCNPDRQTV